MNMILAAIAVVALGAWYVTSSSTGNAAGPVEGGFEFEETASEFGLQEMTLGDPDAPVTIVEYASFTCPHCARFHADGFKQLKADFIDTGKINFVYREVFFDRPGIWASMVARCGGPEKFHGITDLLYKSQSTWSRAGTPEAIVAELGKIGRLAGLDGETLDACLQDAEKAENLNKWQTENLAADGINSTPSFVINGKKYSNMAYPEMKNLIETALGN
jgi:protein-disulfide isomerase